MKVVVCIKQTPSTTAVLSVNDGQVSWEEPGGKPFIVNPWDEYAIEEAIQLKENRGASDVIALTSGDENSNEALKTCLAMGCTEAIRLHDDSFLGSDSLGTSHILAAAIKKIGADAQIVLCGKQAIEGDTGQIPVQLARKLGWTPLTYVSKIVELTDSSITVERIVDQGTQTVTTALPVVISVVKEINDPRYPSFMGIRKANRATIPIWNAADLELDTAQIGAAASKVDWSNIYPLPVRDQQVEMIPADDPAKAAEILVDKLFAEKVI